MKEFIKKFNNHNAYTAFTLTEDFVKPNVSLCVLENEMHYNPYVRDYSKEYLTFVAKEDGTFQLSKNAVSYSLDNGETWTELAAATASPTVTTGNKIMWKGTIFPSTSSPQGIGTFSSTGNFDVQGNAMSLLYGDNFKGQTSLTGKNHAFRRLFYNNTKVVNAENLSLPATTLANYCYYSMFQGCTSLTTAPELLATTLAEYCYSSMFWGCTSLTTVPELSATILIHSCYKDMFSGCTSLTTAPVLPATTLAESCYQNMFIGCTNLTTTPELPATTLANYCYSSMFSDCTSLTIAPVLPAITLVNNCYGNMFSGCTNLNYIKAMFTTTPSSTYTNNWVYRVTSSGTFVKNSAARWNVTGIHGVPTNWTVQTASE